MLAVIYELNSFVFIYVVTTEQNAVGAAGRPMVQESRVEGGPGGIAALPYYDTIRYDKFHLTPRQRRQNRDLTKNRLVQDILKKTYSVWTVDAVSWIRE